MSITFVYPWNRVENDGYGNPRIKDQHPGLTLRQHYAGLAMQGLLTNPNRCPGGEVEGGPLVYASLVARVSLEFADALIAAEKESKS